eukprot:CAMPEP_0185595404 /NCGR_PEP_ID=MMETSP0434-20130131/78275_1 /TAXON_ID=626734 ORGANISM="Favella taraikaensis, Strain Fe Narragansett Bay" /NCGR_SAMPLE_ID=MMETSP0434 /ASSEMBLY_ACC=CAM_ASM_000379 /LENGTH=130 /DNA_ID=CAMNT_0028223377 /DNA_START=632 /DNA_END=1023 /DNA_ORIENTATION=+
MASLRAETSAKRPLAESGRLPPRLPFSEFLARFCEELSVTGAFFDITVSLNSMNAPGYFTGSPLRAKCLPTGASEFDMTAFMPQLLLADVVREVYGAHTDALVTSYQTQRTVIWLPRPITQLEEARIGHL